MAAITDPAAAQTRLVPGEEVRAELTAADEIFPDGSHFHCYLLESAPGDFVSIVLHSEVFDSLLMVAQTENCGAHQPLYANDDYSRDSLDAAIRFRSAGGVHNVLVNTVEAGQLGSYILESEIGPGPGPGFDAIGETVAIPEGLVRELYRNSVQFDFSDLENTGRWFTPELAAMLNEMHRATGGFGVGFDVLVDGQDALLTEVAISHSVIGPGGSEVRVTFRNFGEPVDLRFFVVESNTGWRIANIRSLEPSGAERWNLDALARGEIEAAGTAVP
jgi:hypothetical protein